jgi:hypothetical protein
VEQERFFRRILKRQFHRINVEPRKAHGGASFVLQQVERLAKYIRQHHQEAVGLLVVIDGDKAGLRKRLEEIRAAAGLAGAPWEAHIASCVPCRSVETWEMWLCGEREIDEETQYKEKFHRAAERGEMSAQQAAEAWFAPLESDDRRAEEARLPALTHGRKEVARLERFATQ